MNGKKAEGVLICRGCQKRGRSLHGMLCRQCWDAMPQAVRNRVWRLFREARGSEEHRAAVQEAIAAARAEVNRSQRR